MSDKDRLAEIEGKWASATNEPWYTDEVGWLIAEVKRLRNYGRMSELHYKIVDVLERYYRSGHIVGNDTTFGHVADDLEFLINSELAALRAEHAQLLEDVQDLFLSDELKNAGIKITKLAKWRR